MGNRTIGTSVTGLIAAALCAFQASAQESAPPSATPSAARVLAGVREYPEHLVEALVELAKVPEWLDQAAERTMKGEPVPWEDATMPAFVRDALAKLAMAPMAIAVASERGAELARLRILRETEASSSVRLMEDLRAAYHQAWQGGAAAWQHALERDPEALDEYADLVTRFCTTERGRNPGFACAQVIDRDYYLACPPDASILAFAQENRPSPTLGRVLESWSRDFGAQRADQQALRGQRPPAPAGAGRGVWSQSASGRQSLWQPDDGSADESVSLVPVLLQPLEDQPEAARLAHASLEHARLWGQPDPPAVSPKPSRQASRTPPPTPEMPPLEPRPYLQPSRPATRSGPSPAARPVTPSRHDHAPRRVPAYLQPSRSRRPSPGSYRPRQYEPAGSGGASLSPAVLDYQPAPRRVTVDTPVYTEVRTRVYAPPPFYCDDDDDDDLEDWAEDMEDWTGIDEDWWKRGGRIEVRQWPPGGWVEEEVVGPVYSERWGPVYCDDNDDDDD